MIKRKSIETIEETAPLKALIVADKHQELIIHLSKVLTTRGCLVKTANHADILHGEKFDYIFFLTDYTSAVNFFHKNLVSKGKFLFIEADTVEIINRVDIPFRILRIGNSGLWNTKELADKILKTIFSTSNAQIVDSRKGHLINPSPIRSIHKPAIKKPVIPASQIAVVTKKKTWKYKIIILIFIFTASVLLSGGYILWSIFSLKNSLLEVRKHFTASNWNEAGNDLIIAQNKINGLKKAYDIFWTLFIPLRDTQLIKDTGVLLAVTNNLLSSGNNFFISYREARNNQIIESERKIVTLSSSVDDAKKRIEQISLPFFSKIETLRFLTSIQDRLGKTIDILPVFRQMFFEKQVKTYLVLFQNNMELRPTGGFIGSFALLTVQEGKILELKIMDVYTADGQLKGHIDPPLPIRKYLSQPNFFLRDSNFDPDFGKSAALALWFIQKELGTTVDGVIGTNLFFVQELLRLTGPLNISDFNNETVTSDNFFFKAQFYAQNDFFPGSTQKKDFLNSVSNVLQLKLKNPADLPLLDLVTSVKRSLDEKNLLFWSSEPSVQNLIEEKGWGGRIVAIECVGEVKNCKADYLAISEANLGVNKANYFITKSVAIGKEVDGNGNLKTTVTLSYENRNIADIFFLFPYINYLRFFLPTIAIFDGLTLNNAVIPPSEIDAELYGGDKTSYGYLLKIAPENKASIKMSYTLPSFLTAETFSYQFLFQKQPGDKISPLVLSVILPESLRIKPLNFRSTAQRDNELFFTTDTSVDRIFAFEKQ